MLLLKAFLDLQQRHRLLPVVPPRYREDISQQLVQACGTGCQPLWRQSKDMLKEEGIDIAAADSSASEPAAAQVQVRSVNSCPQIPHNPPRHPSGPSPPCILQKSPSSLPSSVSWQNCVN